MKNFVFLIICFYFLTLLQTSFFPHFSLFTSFPLLVLSGVILINLFEARKEKSGLISAFFGGFFLDIFSENFIGFWVLILLAISIFVKFIFKKHVRIPIIARV